MSKAFRGLDIDKSLRKKGFHRRMDGKHVEYRFQTQEGFDMPIFTQMSHGMMGYTLSVDLISKMARQLRLTKQQFLDLIDCRLSESGYREIIER
jgi:hypothetical protein